MNIHTARVVDLLALQAQGAKWLRVAHYSYGDHDKGELLSWHKTHAAANLAARGATFQAILPLANVLDEARYCENLALINEANTGPEAA